MKRTKKDYSQFLAALLVQQADGKVKNLGEQRPPCPLQFQQPCDSLPSAEILFLCRLIRLASLLSIVSYTPRVNHFESSLFGTYLGIAQD